MSAVVGALRVNLGLNSAEFQKNMGKANKSMNRFAKRAGVAMAAGVTAISAGLAVMTRQSLSTIDMQAKLAKSLGTTTRSLQIMERAGDLTGVAFSGIEQATKDLQRRLSQAADGTGPAVTALKRLGLSASDLMKLPLDERIKVINEAIAEFIP
ncbi:MAG: hypothetical protein KAJ19_15795, partial [Gammaproteobacteria bacterium]|nr:hypothetical protein [Gammaproteobacteria bacterium]